jgi:integrase
MKQTESDQPEIGQTSLSSSDDDPRYSAADRTSADLNAEEEMGRKRERAAGRYKPESSWSVDRSIFNQGVTAAGAGSIVYKGKDAATGKYKFLLRHQWFVDAERKTASKQITASNASDAERQLTAWVQQLRNGRIVPRVAGTLADYVEGPWRQRRIVRNAGSTLKTEDGIWNARIKPFLGHLRNDQLTREVLREWVAANASGQLQRRTARQADGTVMEREVRLSTKPRTVKNAKALLTTILNDLVEDGYLAQSPMPRPPRRKSRKERVQADSPAGVTDDQYWTREEVSEFWRLGLPVVRGEAVLKYPRRRTSKEVARGRVEPSFNRMNGYGAAMTFMFGAFGLAFGTRPGETCAARWSDLTRAGEGWLLDVSASIGRPDAIALVQAGCPSWDRTLTKTGVSAHVSDHSGFVERVLLPLRAMQDELIRQGKLKNPEGYIFVKPDGSFYNPDTMREKWQHLLNGLGLRRITPYGLRHTHATLLLEDGVSISAISQRLRHADVTVTAKVYAHVTERLKQRTAGRVGAAGLVPAGAGLQPQADVPQPDEHVLGLRVDVPADAAEGDKVVNLTMWRQRKQA